MDPIAKMRETLALLIQQDSSDDLVTAASRALDWFSS